MPVLSTLGAAIANVYGFTSGLIKDQYFNLVSLLLPGNGTNGAQNNTFLDSSTNNFTITRNGDVTQGTFSPFSQTGWGNRFGGTVDYITAADSADFDIGSSNFCIECWFWFESRESYSSVIGQWASGQKNFKFGFLTTDALTFTYSTNGTNETDLAQTGTLSTNSWHHIVACRSGTGTNQFAIFIDGSRVHNSTLSATFFNSTAALGIGGDATGACVGGYISNARVVVGSAVYDPTLSTLTVPTSPLTAITNTKLLTCQSNRFIDTNTQVAAKTLTVNGSPSVTPFSPFAPTSSYSAAAVGGSGYFDGANDYLDAGNQTALHLGSGNFTIEMWLWKNANTAYMIPCGDFNGGGTNTFQIIGDATGTKIAWYNGASSSFALTSSSSLPINTWNHIAFVRNSGTLSLYINGSSDGTPVSLGTDYNATTSFIIGNTTELSAGRWWFGYISNLRIVKGTAVYTGNFTPPTKPLATSGADSAGSYPSTNNINTSFAGSATSLLLNFTNAGVVDATAKNVLETEGNAQISTAQSKWGGGSIYFDGTGDWLTVPKAGNWSIGSSEPFTIEAWVYLTAAQANYRALLSDYNSGSPGSSKYLFINSSGIEFQLGTTAGTVASCTQSFSQNQWYYIAITRNSSNVISMYVDGVSKTVSQATQSGAFLDVGSIFYVGRWGGTTAYEWYGYIDDLRITKGVARTITASPSAPFPLQ
jgi:hypothetical protein